jgi:hypothetical protein
VGGRRKRCIFVLHSIPLSTTRVVFHSFSNQHNTPLYQKPIIGGSNSRNEASSHRHAISDFLSASRQSRYRNSWLSQLEHAPVVLIPSLPTILIIQLPFVNALCIRCRRHHCLNPRLIRPRPPRLGDTVLSSHAKYRSYDLATDVARTCTKEQIQDRPRFRFHLQRLV